jgi:RNA polymerase sigma factor (sigma-70 family)
MFLWKGQSRRALILSKSLEDLIQDVYTKLLQNDGQSIKRSHGQTDDSAFAFLASVARSVVTDHVRASMTARRSADMVSWERFDGNNRQTIIRSSRTTEFFETLEETRHLLTRSGDTHREQSIFKLHFIEGMTAREIACAPECRGLKPDGVEAVIKRIRKKLTALRVTLTEHSNTRGT